MQRVLILYGTTDGHTRKIAAVMGGVLENAGICVDLRDASHSAGLNPAGYDGVIVAASVHARGYQKPVRLWVRRNAQLLSHRPGAFVSVCLGILTPAEKVQRDVRDILERFLRECAWRPQLTRIVAGALPYTRYGWLKKRIMRRLVKGAGGDTDMTRDYEYTNWSDVRAFARQFAATVAPPPPAPVCSLSPALEAR